MKAKQESAAAETKEKIIAQALEQSSQFGLEGLTIGKLADALQMSKSGLFGHFGSKERLQIEVLKHVASRFNDDVLKPAFREPPGIARIQALVSLWMQWSETAFQGGCPFAAAVMEYDDRPGPVRDELVSMMEGLNHTLKKLAEVTTEAGDFAPDCDAGQFAFEVSGMLLAFHQAYRLLGDQEAHLRIGKAIEALIQRFSL